MRLLKVELQRFFARRLVRVGTIAAVGVIILVLVGVGSTAKPPTEAERAAVQVEYERALADWEEDGDEWIADCKEGEADEKEQFPEADWQCDDIAAPQLEDWGIAEQELSDTLEPALGDVSLLLVALAFLLGVGFVAAEISTGAIGNWLTFEPRRVSVYASKVGAAALGIIPLTLGLIIVFVAGAYGVFAFFDTLGDVTGEVWGGVAEVAARTVALTAVIAAVGVGLGALLKHTAAALGLFAGYAIVVEGILAGQLPAISPYLLVVNLTAVIKGKGEYWVLECVTSASGSSCQSVARTVSLAHGVTVVGLFAVVVIVVAGLVFRRRDVT